MSDQVHPAKGLSFASLAPDFLLYAGVELNFTSESIIKYRDCIKRIASVFGNQPVTAFSKSDLLRLKADMKERNLSISRQVSILAALKRFLAYTKSELNLEGLDLKEITFPKRQRRDVEYLSAEEVQDFVESINVGTRSGTLHVAELRFRTLVEVLLGTAMRIGEVLSLDRSQVDLNTAEATIVGKGRKQRTVFFSARAMSWIMRYLSARSDEHAALFVSLDGMRRLKRLLKNPLPTHSGCVIRNRNARR